MLKKVYTWVEVKDKDEGEDKGDCEVKIWKVMKKHETWEVVEEEDESDDKMKG